jgi:hypothetical protein
MHTRVPTSRELDVFIAAHALSRQPSLILFSLDAKRAMNRSYRTLSVTVFALTVFTAAASVVEMPTSVNTTHAEPRRLHRWTSLDWAHRDYPLFSLFGPFDHKPGFPAVATEIREKKSALDVYDFREVILAEDEKGMTVGLNEENARVLKGVARKGDRRWFIATAPPKDTVAGEPSVAVVEVIPADGQIIFRHPECASIAQNLRRRFRIAEFRLTPR